MAELEHALEKRDAQYTASDQYHRGVNEVRDLETRLASVYILAKEAADRADWWVPWHFGWLFGWLFGNPNPNMHQPSSAATAQTAVSSTTEADAQPLPDGPAATGGPTIPVRAKETQKAPFDPIAEASALCTPTVSASATSAGAPKESNEGQKVSAGRPWHCAVLADAQSEFLFSKIIGVGFYGGSVPPILSNIAKIQAHMVELNGWVLPLLYGVLGASVFLMRNMLETRTPNIDFFAALIRIALGGIAGIVIGWFWVPGASKNAELAVVTSAPFVLAFLVGFSIDILFSLLDRLNRTISEEPGRGAPPSTPSSSVAAPAQLGGP
jgi:hypothetical protein